MNLIYVKTDEDIKELAALASEIWHEYWTMFLSYDKIDYMLEKFQSEAAIKDQIENERYEYCMLEDYGVVFGYFGVCPKEDSLFVSKFYIKRNYLGLGFGKLVYDKIQQIAMEHNRFVVQLVVNKSNNEAIFACEKLGFVIVDECVTDLGDGLVMDDYIMELRL